MTSPADLRDEGQAVVLAADAAINRGYADLIAEAVDYFGSGLTAFTAEEIREYIEDHHPDARPHSPNVIGATLGGMAAAGYIEAISYLPSRRPSSRHRVLRLWKRPLHKAPSALPLPAEVEEAGWGGAVPTPAPPSSPGWSH